MSGTARSANRLVHGALRFASTRPRIALFYCVSTAFSLSPLRPIPHALTPFDPPPFFLHFAHASIKHVRALIKTQIWRAPKLLMVQLKRFTHTNAGYSSYGFFGRGAGLGEKVSTPVDFPVRGLSLESYVACKGWPGAAKDEDNDDDDGDDIEEEQEGRAGAVTASTGSTEIDEKDGEEAGEREKKEEGEEEKKEAAAVDNKVTPAIYKMAQKAAVQREKPGMLLLRASCFNVALLAICPSCR